MTYEQTEMFPEEDWTRILRIWAARDAFFARYKSPSARFTRHDLLAEINAQRNPEWYGQPFAKRTQDRIRAKYKPLIPWPLKRFTQRPWLDKPELLVEAGFIDSVPVQPHPEDGPDPEPDHQVENSSQQKFRLDEVGRIIFDEPVELDEHGYLRLARHLPGALLGAMAAFVGFSVIDGKDGYVDLAHHVCHILETMLGTVVKTHV